MSSSLPQPIDDYTAPERMALNEAAWNAAMNSIGARIRALEALRVEWESLIALGTGQALDVIRTNVAPQLTAAAEALTTLQAGVAEAEDIVAQIVTGSVPLGAVEGLATALAALAPKASPDLTGLPKAPTAAAGTATAQIATTAFVAGELATGLATKASTSLVATKASRRNRHINPGFRICQDRNAGDEATMLACNGYAFDGVLVSKSGTMVVTAGRASKTTPGGSPYRLRVGVSTAQASLGSTDYASITFPVEGVDVSDLMFGSPSALSFVWRGIINRPAGTWGLAFRNAVETRSYVTTVTISPSEADTDKLVSVSVPGDTTGTWIKDASGAGLYVHLALAAGSAYCTSTVGTWQAGNYVTTPAQTNGVASTGAVTEIADIGLYDCTDAPSFELADYDDDLRRCRRLFRPARGWAGLAESSTILCALFSYDEMRLPPAVTKITGSVLSARYHAGDLETSSWSIGAATSQTRSAWVQIMGLSGLTPSEPLTDRCLHGDILWLNARL